MTESEIAKDLVQDTFVSALRNLASFRGDSSEKTWLFSILKNRIIDHYRRKGSDKTVPLSGAGELSGPDSPFDEKGEWKTDARPLNWGEPVQDELRAREFREILHACLARLSGNSRAVFTLRYLDELGCDEICKELSISPSNYWVIMHRAKLQLRQCIEKHWIHD